MEQIVSEIIDGYFMSQQHDDFLLKNNTDEEMEVLVEELLKELGEDAKEEINNSLYVAFNKGEYYGIMQGIGIGLRLLQECS